MRENFILLDIWAERMKKSI